MFRLIIWANTSKTLCFNTICLRCELNCLNIQSTQNKSAIKYWDFMEKKKFNNILFFPLVLQYFICAPNQSANSKEETRCSEYKNTNSIPHRLTLWQLYLKAQYNMQHLLSYQIISPRGSVRKTALIGGPTQCSVIIDWPCCQETTWQAIHSGNTKNKTK